jgi:hypothetical protein
MVGIWHALRKNDDFMMLFADRVFKHCFNDGVLTDANSIARWQALNTFIEDAVVAESARWGDARRSRDEPTRTRDETFRPAVENVTRMMDGSVDRFIDVLRREGYYPRLDPPQLEVRRKLFGTPSAILQNPNDRGRVVYTVNGDDPRLSGGAGSPDAIEGDAVGSIFLTVPFTLIKARVKAGAEWSAMLEIGLCRRGLWPRRGAVRCDPDE